MEQEQTKSQKVKRFIKEVQRVLRITKKPNKTEFASIVKVTGLGLIIIGSIGFLIFVLKQVLF
ncbi:protein translocase SEC61 complex subunit gamma [Candidatus Woesearchaeota archaeon]|jgi:protein transport protein SEC61 subunit gamma and related proteins|nr:protein translocase SEC61 complex subunit gamma [Candidatus Woesearchaeota archaeon]MBT4150627.1 protein translocase SEC61 complex subunit gamma [Candidatus Woesearchaeota archaeon]MBT4247845.1 protein translocase SEC61 complex subunit gamma [Candidatus Woesearchaeota archaeon]MBT4434269.1 protein translocase SEC61 complex subunit gamma [Candidatus Woesearchaeota archaeon]MBT7331810.1 protein translocase SEC61 complex subunit gamma [Candidatus Woesearchaeota archaeon]